MTSVNAPEPITATEQEIALITDKDSPDNRLGIVSGHWECRVEAIEVSPSNHNVQMTFTYTKQDVAPVVFRTGWVMMEVNGAAQTFSLPGMPGIGGIPGHLVGNITQAVGAPIVFNTISADLDPIWLIGARNIALNDIDNPTENEG